MEHSLQPENFPAKSARPLRQTVVQAGEENLQSGERFRLLVDSVQDYAIFILDRNGNISSWNEGARRSKGYSAEEIIGRHFSVFYTPEDVARAHPQAELEIATREGRYEEEGWRVRKDGSRFWASVVITALREKNGELIGFGKVTRDLTERRRAEENLKLTLEQTELRVAERTQELSDSNRHLKEAVHARDEFLSIASHELRTPLTPLKLQIQSLVRQLRSETVLGFTNERVMRMAQTCEKSITKLATLVDNLLDISRLESGKFQLSLEELDATQLVGEVIERYRSDIESVNGSVSFHAPGPVKAVLDRLRLEQVLTNLLTNAMKYGNGKPIAVNVQAEGENLRLSVQDKGKGIALADQERIFERFERVNSESNVNGLGLGLYITRQIVSAHGGTIRMVSREGEGSEFVVEIPLRRSS